MMTVKGTTASYVCEFIEKTFGKEALTRWLESLSPQAKQVYSAPIMPVNLYPMKEIYYEPTVKICELFYGGDIKKGSLEVGRYSADYALKGVYKFFVKLGSPVFLIKKAGSILPTYYQPSKMEVVDVQDNSGVVRITEFPEISDVVEMRIVGWIQRALEISGVKNIKVEITKSFLKGDDCTEFKTTWE